MKPLWNGSAVFGMLFFVVSFISDGQVVTKGETVSKPQLKAAITIVKPNAQTVWTIGKRAVVTWRKLGVMGSQVKIGLVPESRRLDRKTVKPVFRPAHIIVHSTENDGEHSFMVPKAIRPGRYVVIMATIDHKVRAASSGFLIFSELTPMPDMVIVYKNTSPSTYPTGEPAGWHVLVEIRNLNHPAVIGCPPTGPCFSIKLQSTTNPSQEIEYPLEAYEIAALKSTGRLEHIINISENHTILQPWRLTVDSQHQITESNESNNSIVVDH